MARKQSKWYICLCDGDFTIAGEGATPEEAYQRCTEDFESEHEQTLDASECRFYEATQINVEVKIQITEKKVVVEKSR